MTPEMWKLLDDYFEAEPVLVAGPVSAADVEAAETRLERRFPPDFAEFLMRYGGGIVGSYRIHGLRNAQAMGRRSLLVTELNEKFRRDGAEEVRDWLIFSTGLSGDPIGIAPDGTIRMIDYELQGGERTLAGDLETFLRKHLTNE